ncbi:mechanosensitive ion channel family protein [Oleiharenicola lentus]|uniref:mechanosensitive ion channel family protein n=1 Tax=Oleiharenicola lentus TaxID=2508720 RepID=UPI003F6716B8
MTLQELIHIILGYIPQIVAALPVAAGIVLCTILISLSVNRSILLIARRTSLDAASVAPFTRMIRWMLHFIALVLILGVFGFEIGGLWAMISTVLGLIAIGFVAVWSLLSNVSSTAFILIMRPFEIGDDIEFAGEPIQGRVVNLNMFFTTLLAHDSRLVQIPNNQFFQKAIKRTRHERPISLAAQLNLTGNADLPPPPAPAIAPAKSPEDSAPRV